MNVEVLFSVIDILRSALTHFVHYVPFISGGPAMWSLSILHVLLLTRYSAPTLTTRQCRNRWKNSSISPHMYTYPFFQSSHVVSVKMPFHPPDQKRRWYTQSGHFYIGSTAISAVKREFNRLAKLKQIRRNLAVHAELSIRYILEHQDRVWIVHVYCFASMHNVRQCLGPWTFVNQFLATCCESSLLDDAVTKKCQGPVKLSPRLYQRVRRRLFSLGPVPSPHSFQEQAWRILYQISLFTRASYEACKRIRSGQLHTLEVYSLYRLATHMEKPGRSRVKSLIGKALLFRNATVPKNSLPLHIPFLAHDNFQTNLETWIRQLILQ
jgi:hypothetical protein